MAESDSPRVSIGLPVWNGEAFLLAAIDSLLAQSFGDLELIICDNASTDRTEVICQEAARKDGRIRYHRNDRNIGLQANTQAVLDFARAPYFMWASHDDLWDPTYLERMVAQLDREAGLVLAGSNAASIDENGDLLGNFDNWSVYAPESTYARARRLICASPGGGQSTLIFALMRTDLIRNLGLARYEGIRVLNRGKYAWDKRALFRLVFEGAFHVSRETLYFHRDVIGEPGVPASRRRLVDELARLSHALKHIVDVHGYFDNLRSIVLTSKLRAREKASLVLVAWAQELKYVAVYFASRLRG